MIPDLVDLKIRTRKSLEDVTAQIKELNSIFDTDNFPFTAKEQAIFEFGRKEGNARTCEAVLEHLSKIPENIRVDERGKRI